jgi:hypothetical protein
VASDNQPSGKGSAARRLSVLRLVVSSPLAWMWMWMCWCRDPTIKVSTCVHRRVRKLTP